MRTNFTKLAMGTVMTAMSVMTFSSCATIFGHSQYPVTIQSVPSDAKVTIVDRKGQVVFMGSTPASVTLKSAAGYMSKAQYSIKVQAPGYIDQVYPLNARLNGWYFGNILLGGLIGMLIVDPASGAMYKMDDPTNVNINLQQETKSALIIKDINELSAKEMKGLVKIN